MKKQILLCTALLTTISAFPQQMRTRPSALISLADKVSGKYGVRQAQAQESALLNETTVPQKQNNVKRSASAVVWSPFSASMNIYGVLYADQKALQYNEDLNAVSYIHRKSPTYSVSPAPAPTAASGAIVGMVTTNWGSKWDSTAIWSNDTYWGRYPQGGLYNPPGNTNISNAHIVAMGPITESAGGWTGNFFASKSLSTFNNAPGTGTMAQQFIQGTTPPYDTIGKVYLAANDFSATDDGLIRTLGTILNDPSGTTAAAQGFRGARIVKGTYNAGGYFNWTSDSLSLSQSGVQMDNTGAYDAIGNLANMAWSESGQYGYVWFIGVRIGATGSNTGFQPVVWKTSNYGGSWSLIPGINFNDTSYIKPVHNHVPSVRTPLSDSNLVIPFFNFREDIAGTVDMNNQLHLVSTLWGSAKSHPDSVGWTSSFLNDDGESYTYGHVDGHRPYIYDFTTQANSTWKVTMIDSMETEAPGTRTTDEGYSSNPWDADPANSNSKVSSAGRIQVSRTPGGEYVIYTWAESNTLVTASGKKWNSIPDVKVRAMDVATGLVSVTKYDITQDDQQVSNNAQMHQVSPKSQHLGTSAKAFTVTVPVKISNSVPLRQLQANTHYFAGAELTFMKFIDNVDEHGRISAQSSVLYPNPASDNTTLSINFRSSAEVNIAILNAVGQVIRTSSASAQAGQNDLNIDTQGLAAGIYLVNIRAGGGTATRKLIIQ